jgi:hypothetical protein
MTIASVPCLYQSLKEDSRQAEQQTADSRQQTADSRQAEQQTADSRQQTADSRQQTADKQNSRQQTADNTLSASIFGGAGGCALHLPKNFFNVRMESLNFSDDFCLPERVE